MRYPDIGLEFLDWAVLLAGSRLGGSVGDLPERRSASVPDCRQS